MFVQVNKESRKANSNPIGYRILANGCWEWVGGCTDGGYGSWWIKGKTTAAHRTMYKKEIGSIPEGLELDHLCRNRRCVNPEHLEPVTQAVNIARGEAGIHMTRRTHCPQGHLYKGSNLYITSVGKRQCRACNRIGKALRYKSRR